MKERPILFSGPMVRALLEGRKTQTRRLMKPQPQRASTGTWFWSPSRNIHHVGDDGMFQFVVSSMSCPYGIPGDRLWVRENFFDCSKFQGVPVFAAVKNGIIFQAEYAYREPDRSVIGRYNWRPSIFMPRRISRILLEVVSVRVERLNQITEADAKAEGVTLDFSPDDCPVERRHIESYAELWDSLNEERGFGWAVNPWVWVVEFRRIA